MDHYESYFINKHVKVWEDSRNWPSYYLHWHIQNPTFFAECTIYLRKGKYSFLSHKAEGFEVVGRALCLKPYYLWSGDGFPPFELHFGHTN